MKKIAFLISIIFFGILFYLGYLSFNTPTVYTAENAGKVELLKSENENVTPLLFIGDIMLGRYVETLKNRNGLDPFGDTTNFLKSHITIANLEGPIPELHKPTPVNNLIFSFPNGTEKYLSEHGIKAVSLSNNHSLDQGSAGYKNTKLALDKEEVSHFGGYDSTSLDYFETKLGTTTVIVFGINMISSKWNEKEVFNFVKFLHNKYPEKYLISFIHWGNEYDLKQNEIQRNIAHKLIDEGVNVIVGSHPHVVQGVEVYNNSPIFYSLGNFIFDQYFSQYTQEGYMLSVDKNNSNFVFKLIPIVSAKSKTNIANENVSKNILNIIKKSSDVEIQKNIEERYITIPILIK